MLTNWNPQSFSIFSAFCVIFGAASIPLTFVIPLLTIIFSTYLRSCVTADSSALYLLHSIIVKMPFLSTPITSMNPYFVCSSWLTGLNPSSISSGLLYIMLLMSSSVPLTRITCPSSNFSLLKKWIFCIDISIFSFCSKFWLFSISPSFSTLNEWPLFGFM